MNKLTTLSVFLLLSFCFFAFTTNDSKMTKREALEQIDTIKKSAQYHVGAIKEIRKSAGKASCCFDYFVVYANRASTVTHSTSMFTDLAKETAFLEEENPLFLEIASVIGNLDLGWVEYRDLVKATLEAKTKEEIEAVQVDIRKYR